MFGEAVDDRQTVSNFFLRFGNWLMEGAALSALSNPLSHCPEKNWNRTGNTEAYVGGRAIDSLMDHKTGVASGNNLWGPRNPCLWWLFSGHSVGRSSEMPRPARKVLGKTSLQHSYQIRVSPPGPKGHHDLSPRQTRDSLWERDRRYESAGTLGFCVSHKSRTIQQGEKSLLVCQGAKQPTYICTAWHILQPVW